MTRSFLTRVLLLDALSCGMIFAAGVAAAPAIASLTGLPEGVVRAGGWICLAAGLLFAVLAIRPVRGLLALGVLGNAAWVVASIAVLLLFFPQLTVLGVAFIAVQAGAVALLTLFEKRGLAMLPAASVASA